MAIKESRTGAALLALLASIICTVAQAATLNLDQHGLTGTWYNPATGGQGLLIETYPDLQGSGHGYLGVGWYTFDLTAAGGQRWYTLQGPAVSGSASVPLTIYTATGGNFNAPPRVSAVAVGSATLSFSDCTHGTLTYHFSDGRPDGSIPLARLDTNVTCTTAGDNSKPTANYLMSGAWYDSTRATSGQGFFLDFSPALTTLFGAWYTYAPSGSSSSGGASQRWYTIQDNAFAPGTVSKNGLPIYETKGGTFNTAGGASAGSPVGRANIAINSCTSITLSYAFTGGTNVGQHGSINLGRVVDAPAGCSPTLAISSVSGTGQQGAAFYLPTPAVTGGVPPNTFQFGNAVNGVPPANSTIDPSGDVLIPGSAAAGTYTFDLCVADTHGQSACAHATAIVQASSATPLPNLTPYQPAGWSDKIVVSTQSGSTTDSNSFLSTDTLYVNWAVINDGDAPASAAFVVQLYVDGAATAYSTPSTLAADHYSDISPSFSLGSLSPGVHTLELVADLNNTIVESNENDNAYSKTITVGSPLTISSVSGTGQQGTAFYLPTPAAVGGVPPYTFQFGNSANGVPPPNSTIYADGEVLISSSAAPGTYTFDICVADTDIQSACAMATAVVQAASSTPLANLTPYQPAGWSDRISVSNEPGPPIDSSPLLSTDTLYVNWAVINDGDAPTSATFDVQLYVDGVATAYWSVPAPFAVDNYEYNDPFSIGSLSVGPHTIKITADPTNAIVESNESDNTYSKTISVVSPPTCTFSISPTNNNSIAAVGGNGQVAVTAPKDCLWSATSNAGWINLTSGVNGNANGVVGYSVAANTATTSRSGTITIAGKTFTITQAGTALACTVSISPTGANFQPGPGAGGVNVTAANTCSWSAMSSDNWISIVPPGSGTGNGTVQFTVAANPGTSSRSGTITISNETYTVTQSGSLCTVTLSPAIGVNHVPSGGASGTVYVTIDPTAPSGCAWQATSQDTWITVTSGASGAGDGGVGYSVAANPGTSPRTGTIVIADQTFTIMQDGSSCTYSISAPSINVPSSGGSGFTVSVTAASGCFWSATSNDSWITVTSGASGTGNGTVYFSVAANSSTSSRNGSIMIAGQTFTVTQAGSSGGGTFYYANWSCGNSSQCAGLLGAPAGSEGPFCSISDCQAWGNTYIPAGYSCSTVPTYTPNPGGSTCYTYP